MLDNIITGLLVTAGVVILWFIIIMLLAFPFMLLWNWVMPLVFGLVELSFWQSWGVLLMSSFIFKSTSVSSE